MLERMVTESRALIVAIELFPDDYTSGEDCHAEAGRIGQPCRICAARNEAWAARVVEVRNAMLKAFR